MKELGKLLATTVFRCH